MTFLILAKVTAALVPLVGLYALTNPQHAPWRVTRRVLYHDVPCRFCYKSNCPQQHNDCLSKVDPSQIVGALQARLQPDSSENGKSEKTLPFRAVQGIAVRLRG